MNAKSLLLTGMILGALCITGRAQDIDSIAPVVVKTVPEAGTKDVPPGEIEINIKFSKPMTDGSWSWSSAWQDSAPDSLGKPHYEADQKTCVMKVKLEPDKTYGYWINSQNFHGFRDAQGHPAIPYLLVFHTKAQ
jgi:Bacterial Ig-like domain